MPTHPVTLPALPIAESSNGPWPTFSLSIAERQAISSSILQQVRLGITGDLQPISLKVLAAQPDPPTQPAPVPWSAQSMNQPSMVVRSAFPGSPTQSIPIPQPQLSPTWGSPPPVGASAWTIPIGPPPPAANAPNVGWGALPTNDPGTIIRSAGPDPLLQQPVSTSQPPTATWGSWASQPIPASPSASLYPPVQPQPQYPDPWSPSAAPATPPSYGKWQTGTLALALGIFGITLFVFSLIPAIVFTIIALILATGAGIVGILALGTNNKRTEATWGIVMVLVVIVLQILKIWLHF